MAITFDGPTLTITLSSGDTTVEVSEIYSRWKDWVLTSDNSKYLPAFRETGGDPLGGGVFAGVNIFIRNDYGWRIKPPEEDIVINLVGNLYPEDPNEVWRAPTTGGYDASINTNNSVNLIASAGSFDGLADAVLDQADGVETGLTMRQALRLMAAALAGKVSGAETSTVVIRNAVEDSKPRITATVDSNGNRTSITTDTD